MCPRHHIQAMSGHLTKELWRKLIDEVAEISPDTIILPFWRGESLLHPNFIEFMEYALNKSLVLHISTNGHFVSEDYSAVLAKCEFVTFSVHTYRGYSRAKEFLSLRKVGKTTTQISFVEGEVTENILHELVASHNLGGFDSVRFYEEHSRNGIFGKLKNSVKTPRTFCPKLLDTLVVAFDGALSRCCHIWETENEINVNGMSIKDVWTSEHFQRIRSGYPDVRCEPCDQWIGHTCGESWRLVDGKLEHKMYHFKGIVNV